MKSVAIYGTGACAKKLINFLNKEKITIKFFIETQPKNDFFLDIPIVSLEGLKGLESEYDYLIIASSFKHEILMNLQSEKILINEKLIIFKENYIEFFYSEIDLMNKLDNFNKMNFEALALGLSYTRDGINSQLFDKKVINLSYSSQDLTADYEILSFLDKYKSLKNVENLILGLGYYSFNHDMSKTLYRDVIARYLSLSKNKRIAVIDEDYLSFKNKLSDFLLKLNEVEVEKVVANKYFHENINEERIKEGIELARKQSIMCYPQTRKENLECLRRILDICNKNSIKILVVIFPTEWNYHKYITNESELNFYQDLNSFRNLYDFQVLDLLRSPNFVSGDFWDTSHLNNTGSKKMVQIINAYLD